MGVAREMKVLPESVTLSQIIKSIPKEAFEKDDSKAIRSLLVTIFFTGLGIYLISISPAWLLPFVWFYTGTAATGLFVIGHDCGHRSFLRSIYWNDVIGTITFAPLLYPFHAWRIQHNVHHQNTNKLNADTAWHPITGKAYMECGPVMKFMHKLSRGSPAWLISTIGHWIIEHFNFALFKGDELAKVKGSTTALSYFCIIFFPLMYYFLGVWGIIKYWAVPWLGFHFWMSTFTLIHHTAPHIPFLHESKWRDAVASLQHTVHCRYPAWIDFLCHDISVHIPHHITTAIPHYNLRLAYDSIQKNWGPYIQECEFSIDLLWSIISNCHIYDDETALYKTFSALLKSVGAIDPKIEPATTAHKQD